MSTKSTPDRALGFEVPGFTEPEARDYLAQVGVLDLLSGDGIRGQYARDYPDLARLHRMIVDRKSFTVLEFGVGWSTVVLAAAIQSNQRTWESLSDKPRIRNSSAFKVYSVDASKDWIDNARTLIPAEFRSIVDIAHSPVEAGSFASRPCHFYRRIPDVVPDFIYLDGPHPSDVRGSVNGLSWANPDRTVMSGDLLLMESTLLPGTCVLVDGRTNNARFLENNLQRRWGVLHHEDADVSVFELQEAPLGSINDDALRFALGDRYFARTES